MAFKDYQAHFGHTAEEENLGNSTQGKREGTTAVDI
jgi:hypothetical protein